MGCLFFGSLSVHIRDMFGWWFASAVLSGNAIVLGVGAEQGILVALESAASIVGSSCFAGMWTGFVVPSLLARHFWMGSFHFWVVSMYLGGPYQVPDWVLVSEGGVGC